MRRRVATALILLFLVAPLLAKTALKAEAAEADSSLVLAALRVIEQDYRKQVDPIRLLNAAIAALRKVTDLGPEALPDIPTGLQGSQAGNAFRRAFDQAAKVGTPSTAELAYAATREMLASLNDSHVYYMDPTQFKEHQDRLAGMAKYAGIGAMIKALNEESDTPAVFVTGVFPGSPAAGAGLKQFDRITGINGTPVPAGVSTKDIVDQIRGPEGSSVTLTILRDGQTSAVSVVRGPIQYSQLEARMIQPGVAYVKLYSFSTGIGDQLRSLLKPLIAQNGIRAMILDLRGNTGGYLREAESVAGIFLPSQTMLVRVLQRVGGATILTAKGELLLPNVTLTVLTDRVTASSSEVLVEGLKKTHRATIVGEKTAGALGVAREVPLPAGGMYVTIGEVVGPQFEQIERVGVTPDNQVELSVADFERGMDSQLDAALKTLGGVILSELIAA
jgi:carboxyl-terminal processing protease